VAIILLQYNGYLIKFQMKQSEVDPFHHIRMRKMVENDTKKQWQVQPVDELELEQSLMNLIKLIKTLSKIRTLRSESKFLLFGTLFN